MTILARISPVCRFTSLALACGLALSLAGCLDEVDDASPASPQSQTEPATADPEDVLDDSDAIIDSAQQVETPTQPCAAGKAVGNHCVPVSK